MEHIGSILPRVLQDIQRRARPILSLCDRTGNMVRPWAEAGFPCVCVDVQHNGVFSEGGITRVGADVRTWVPDFEPSIVFAFPPCTNLAVSGARWFRDKGLRGLIDALELVEACRSICEQSGAPWMLENPISTLSTYWREPDFRFDPCDYAGYLDDPLHEAYTKRTCLWVGNGFCIPEPSPVFPALGSLMHRLPPTPNRADIRSETPRGFALAVFRANSEGR